MVELTMGVFIFMLFATIIGCITTILCTGWLICEIITDYINNQINKTLNMKDEYKEDKND